MINKVRPPQSKVDLLITELLLKLSYLLFFDIALTCQLSLSCVVSFDPVLSLMCAKSAWWVKALCCCLRTKPWWATACACVSDNRRRLTSGTGFIASEMTGWPSCRVCVSVCVFLLAYSKDKSYAAAAHSPFLLLTLMAVCILLNQDVMTLLTQGSLSPFVNAHSHTQAVTNNWIPSL